ncbi:uncharacterized protein JCM6883_001664 [Sporobolomyces salmoneus]|uniref:uncharacterized protein n=1 Tax=Sporobolomyces salmoneus TaxID=183962 RepID=UPI003172C116
MAPIDPLQADKGQAFHVHLTGFGPFNKVPINPSWEAVQKLHDTILPNSPGPDEKSSTRPREIRLTSSLIPVKYAAVLSQIPPLHSTGFEGSVPDLIIHVGVGLEGAIRLEQRARKYGFEKLDVDGQLGPLDELENKRGFRGDEWIEMEEELRTTITGERVVQSAKRRGLEFVELSEDAGLYLCEFTYYASLASASKTNSGRPTPVQFIHVPPLEKPYSLDQLTSALKVLILSIMNEGGLRARNE